MKDTKHGKVIEKILDFPNKVEEYESWLDDQSTRQGYIVGDGRVSDFLDDDDVLKTCERLQLSPRELVAVRTEFDAERLQNIWHHMCEVESDHYIDWLYGCSYTNYRKQTQMYREYLHYQKDDCESCWLSETVKDRQGNITKVYSMMKYHLKEFQEFEKKGWSAEKVWKHYYKKHKEEIEALDLLEFIKSPTTNLWGGKYPTIVPVYDIDFHDDRDFSNLAYYIKEAQEEVSNKAFYDTLLQRADGVWSRYNSVQEVLDIIDDFIYKSETATKAVDFVNEYIDDVTKHFKSGLLEQLELEISEFVANELSIEDRLKEGLAKIDTLVRFIGTEAITNQGAHAPIQRIKEVISKHHAGFNVVGDLIGPYRINSIIKMDDDTFFKIGCHLFRLSDVEEKLNLEYA